MGTPAGPVAQLPPDLGQGGIGKPPPRPRLPQPLHHDPAWVVASLVVSRWISWRRMAAGWAWSRALRRPFCRRRAEPRRLREIARERWRSAVRSRRRRAGLGTRSMTPSGPATVANRRTSISTRPPRPDRDGRVGGLPTKRASWGTPLPVGVEIGLEGPYRPVGGGAASAPLPPGALPRPRGGVQGEPGRRQRPAVARSAEHRGGSGSRSPPPPARPPPPRPRAWRSGLDARPRSAGSRSRARNLRPPPSALIRPSVTMRPTASPSRAATPRFAPPADPGRGADPQRTCGRGERSYRPWPLILPQDQAANAPCRDGSVPDRSQREAVTGWMPCPTLTSSSSR